MKKTLIALIAIILILILTTASYFFLGFKEPLNDNSNLKNNEKDSQTNEQTNFQESQNKSEENGENSGDNGKGGGGGESDDSSLEIQTDESNCLLVRPGNLPEITCSVNYITKDNVSLNILNKIGQSMNIKINLNQCAPELTETIENEQEQEFIFSCKNKDVFNQEILVTYILSESQNIEIKGIVSGLVV